MMRGKADWIGDYDKRFTDNAHIIYWHAAERKAADVPKGWGLTLSLSQLFNKHWEPKRIYLEPLH